MRPHSPSPPRASHRAGFFTSKRKSTIYRKTNSRSSRQGPQWIDAVPRWTFAQTEATSHLAKILFLRFGITGLGSYFGKWWAPVAICALLSVAMGAYFGGFQSALWYGLAGLAAPAALIWLTAVLSYAAVYLLVFFAVWALLINGLLWLLQH